MPPLGTRFGALALVTTLLSLQSLATPIETYDYIIVGAGTSGLLLANRLSEDASFTVAVIDPGADERNNVNVVNPLSWLGLSGTSVNWNYSTVPQDYIGDRVLSYAAGRGIGGTSLINGMTYIRGDRAQFDAWEDLYPGSGWNWDTMIPYYKKAERFFPPSPWQEAVGALYEAEYHGSSGGIDVGFNPVLLNGSFYENAKTTWANLGQSLDKDVNSGYMAGFDVWPQTLNPVNNTRCDAATAFYWPVQDRPNLTLINGTVSRILWKPGMSRTPEASGVEYVMPNGQNKTVKVVREVILSAGALRTPLILELSGIGYPKILEELGIETVVDLPGVGENLIDQPNTGLSYSTNNTFFGYAPYATFVNATSLFGNGDGLRLISDMIKLLIPHWGLQIYKQTRRALKAEAAEEILRVQYDLIFKKDVTIGEILSTASGTGTFSAYWCTLPFSRGSVHLNSTDDINTPKINPRFMSLGLDMIVQVALGRLATTFWNTPPMSASIKTQPQQGMPSLDDTWNDWTNFTETTMISNSHPIGTAAMLPRRLGGVVNSQLRVYGTKNVRVVDASVIPLQISGHLTATLYAIAERAAAEFIIPARYAV
ncbi:hypothetical protein GGI42DRAFT_55756 [Trichoderma sp. SZMC 28013]